MECGQPLHAFDLAKLTGRQIIVRQASRARRSWRSITRRYALDPSMCVIADAQRAVALGGVMGGAETEVTADTTEVLIESAEFDPVSIRNTARAAEPAQRLVVSLRARARSRGSRLGQPPVLRVDSGTGRRRAGRRRRSTSVASPSRAQPITLRFAQLKRVLGIDDSAAGGLPDPDGAGQSRSCASTHARSKWCRRPGAAT